jgi:hypothetical protein
VTGFRTGGRVRRYEMMAVRSSSLRLAKGMKGASTRPLPPTPWRRDRASWPSEKAPMPVSRSEVMLAGRMIPSGSLNSKPPDSGTSRPASVSARRAGSP